MVPYKPTKSLKDWHPTAREEGLVLTTVDDELLIYDLDRHHLHRLNAITQAFWKSCDGSRTLDAIADETGRILGQQLTEGVVLLALRQLAEASLLDGRSLDLLPRESRREMVRKVAIAGAVALPSLMSISAPTAAQTRSCDPEGYACMANSECCSGNCYEPSSTCKSAICLPAESTCLTDAACCSGICNPIALRCHA